MQNYSCSFTGTRFTLATQDELLLPATISSLHPMMLASTAHILQLPNSYLKLSALLYKLVAVGLVSYKPHKAFAPTDSIAATVTINKLCYSLHNILPAILSTSAAKLSKAPKFLMNRSTLTEISGYVEALADWDKERELHWELSKAAVEAKKETKTEQAARVASKMQLNKVLAATARWADEVLVQRCNSYNVMASAALRECLAGQKPLYTIRKMRELLLDFLPEDNIVDAIRKEALVQALDDQIATILSSFGSSAMLSAEEREASEAITSRYSFAKGSDVPASVQALRAMTAPQAAKPMPVASDYSSPIAFTIALAAWKSMNSTSTSTSTSE